MMTTDEMLNQAIVAYKAGRKSQARQLLEQVLRHDRSNEAAWLWMSGVVETDDERLACLEYVLDINPGNQVAQRGLARLQASAQASPPSGAVAQPTPSPDVAPQPPPARAVKAQERQSTLTPAWRLLGGIAVVLVAAVVGYVLVSEVLKSSLYLSGFFLAPSGEEKTSEWQVYTSQEGHFQVTMPGSPKKDVESVNTLIGKVDLYLFTVEADDFGYIVGYGDYPSSFVNSGNVEAMLDGARDGAVSNVNGKLVGERRIKVQGFPGRDLWVEATIGGEVGMAQMRIVLVGNRLYQVLVAGPKERFAEGQAEKCLNSFKVIR
jgi:hypothetical protein